MSDLCFKISLVGQAREVAQSRGWKNHRREPHWGCLIDRTVHIRWIVGGGKGERVAHRTFTGNQGSRTEIRKTGGRERAFSYCLENTSLHSAVNSLMFH